MTYLLTTIAVLMGFIVTYSLRARIVALILWISNNWDALQAWWPTVKRVLMWGLPILTLLWMFGWFDGSPEDQVPADTEVAATESGHANVKRGQEALDAMAEAKAKADATAKAEEEAERLRRVVPQGAVDSHMALLEDIAIRQYEWNPLFIEWHQQPVSMKPVPPQSRFKGWMLLDLGLEFLPGSQLVANVPAPRDLVNSRGVSFRKGANGELTYTLRSQVAGDDDVVWVKCFPVQTSSFIDQKYQVSVTPGTSEQKGGRMAVWKNFSEGEQATVCVLPGKINGHDMDYAVKVTVLPLVDERGLLVPDQQGVHVPVPQRDLDVDGAPRFMEAYLRHAPPSIAVDDGRQYAEMGSIKYPQTLFSSADVTGKSVSRESELKIRARFACRMHVAIHSTWPKTQAKQTN